MSRDINYYYNTAPSRAGGNFRDVFCKRLYELRLERARAKQIFNHD